MFNTQMYNNKKKQRDERRKKKKKKHTEKESVNTEAFCFVHGGNEMRASINSVTNQLKSK